MKNKFGFKTKPKIRFIANKQNAENVLGMTGHYDPETQEICIYCYGRHPKDILRSLAHELMHHVQHYEGSLTADNSASENDPNYIVHDKYLEGIEADAFERGNIAFRFWEAETKMNDRDYNSLLDQEGKKMEEAGEPKTKQGKKAKETRIRHAIEKNLSKDGNLSKNDMRIAAATAKIEAGTGKKRSKEESVEESMNENKEPEVNEALKDSVVYQPTDRACNDMYNNREETVFQDLLKKFGIKKQNG